MDPVFHNFLTSVWREAKNLQARSDVLTITPLPPLPPSTFLAEFELPYLQRLRDGLIGVAPGPISAVLRFPENYLRSADPLLSARVVSVLTDDLVHPNVYGPVVCLGSAFAPGTPLVPLLWELWEIFTYQNLTLDERNALDPEACRLLRAHPGLLAQLTIKPFLRRQTSARVEVRNV